ncbi:Dynamin-1-like protein [Venturia nashicola]|uniref:Dynamin-1-like protein n=1 Tax=Venturia nashicola TaxID=86259 RepID=A0A4Z1PB59_9PEZI|nr:Dynamin-1-like protein [Venturia nashicola]
MIRGRERTRKEQRLVQYNNSRYSNSRNNNSKYENSTTTVGTAAASTTIALITTTLCPCPVAVAVAGCAYPVADCAYPVTAGVVVPLVLYFGIEHREGGRRQENRHKASGLGLTPSRRHFRIEGKRAAAPEKDKEEVENPSDVPNDRGRRIDFYIRTFDSSRDIKVIFLGLNLFLEVSFSALRYVPSHPTSPCTGPLAGAAAADCVIAPHLELEKTCLGDAVGRLLARRKPTFSNDATKFQRLVYLSISATHGADDAFETKLCIPAVMSRMIFSDDMAKYYSFNPNSTEADPGTTDQGGD